MCVYLHYVIFMYIYIYIYVYSSRYRYICRNIDNFTFFKYKFVCYVNLIYPNIFFYTFFMYTICLYADVFTYIYRYMYTCMYIIYIYSRRGLREGPAPGWSINPETDDGIRVTMIPCKGLFVLPVLGTPCKNRITAGTLAFFR